MKRLLARSMLALVVCAVLVTAAYFLIDRPVAFFVHDHHIDQVEFLKWLTFIPVALTASAPVVLVLGVILMARRPLTPSEKACCAAAVSLMVTEAFRSGLAVVFGRYWPETWIDHNPSLIQDGAYGFHPFHAGSAYDSFPSGHTARTLAVVSVFWIGYPRWRWVGAVVAIAVVVGLVGRNYHFVGDTLGGAFLGSIIGAYTSRFWGIPTEKRQAST